MFKFNKIFLMSMLTVAGALNAQDDVDDMSAWRSVGSIRKAEAVRAQHKAEQLAADKLAAQKEAFEDVIQFVRNFAANSRAKALTKCERHIGETNALRRCIDETHWCHYEYAGPNMAELRARGCQKLLPMINSFGPLVDRELLIEKVKIAVDEMEYNYRAHVNRLIRLDAAKKQELDDAKKQAWYAIAKRAAPLLGLTAAAVAFFASQR